MRICSPAAQNMKIRPNKHCRYYVLQCMCYLIWEKIIRFQYICTSVYMDFWEAIRPVSLYMDPYILQHDCTRVMNKIGMNGIDYDCNILLQRVPITYPRRSQWIPNKYPHSTRYNTFAITDQPELSQACKTMPKCNASVCFGNLWLFVNVGRVFPQIAITNHQGIQQYISPLTLWLRRSSSYVRCILEFISTQCRKAGDLSIQ